MLGNNCLEQHSNISDCGKAIFQPNFNGVKFFEFLLNPLNSSSSCALKRISSIPSISRPRKWEESSRYSWNIWSVELHLVSFPFFAQRCVKRRSFAAEIRYENHRMTSFTFHIISGRPNANSFPAKLKRYLRHLTKTGPISLENSLLLVALSPPNAATLFIDLSKIEKTNEKSHNVHLHSYMLHYPSVTWKENVCCSYRHYYLQMSQKCRHNGCHLLPTLQKSYQFCLVDALSLCALVSQWKVENISSMCFSTQFLAWNDGGE